jgi:phosphomevalonate kinase
MIFMACTCLQIEPPSQTALLDATMEMDGVLLAGVPGAGGFDAVFAVTIGSTVRDKVELDWSSRGVLSLSVQEDPNGVSLEKVDPREA